MRWKPEMVDGVRLVRDVIYPILSHFLVALSPAQTRSVLLLKAGSRSAAGGEGPVEDIFALSGASLLSVFAAVVDDQDSEALAAESQETRLGRVPVRGVVFARIAFWQRVLTESRIRSFGDPTDLSYLAKTVQQRLSAVEDAPSTPTSRASAPN
jgi:hypothetical protein